MDFGGKLTKFCIFRLGFSKKEVCFAAVYLSTSWGVAAVPACSVIMGIIIVIDQSCNNGKNIWNNSASPYRDREGVTAVIPTYSCIPYL